jgi:hypothetical protein
LPAARTETAELVTRQSATKFRLLEPNKEHGAPKLASAMPDRTNCCVQAHSEKKVVYASPTATVNVRPANSWKQERNNGESQDGR